eukprot:scaffold95780_cov15-Tisochrysis_lutea.AAC.1
MHYVKADSRSKRHVDSDGSSEYRSLVTLLKGGTRRLLHTLPGQLTHQQAHNIQANVPCLSFRRSSKAQCRAHPWMCKDYRNHEEPPPRIPANGALLSVHAPTCTSAP